MRHKLFWPLVISTLIALYLCPVRPAQTQPQQCNLQLCTFGTDGCYKVTFQNIWKTPGADSASGINIYPKIEIDGSSVLDCSSQSISNRTDLIVNLPLSSGSYSLKLTLTAKLKASGIIVAQTAHTENFSTDTHQCPTCQIPMGQDGLSLSGCQALCTNRCGDLVGYPNGCVCAACASGTSCINNQCQGCPAGFKDCNNNPADGCETPINTIANCGACGKSCTFPNASALCSGGSCALGTCNSGFGNCDGNSANGCETPLSSISNCGSCGKSCSFQNASAVCSNGSCALGTCNPGFDNCDNNSANGCETSLSSISNCGTCGKSCSFQNASALCSGGSCALGTCNSGFGDCDGNPANGCESALNSVTSCGACGVACTGAERCLGGSCQVPCTPGDRVCAGFAVKLCDRDGIWHLIDCLPPSRCRGNMCEAFPCTGHDSPVCVDRRSRGFCENGSWTVEQCPANQVCDQGLCSTPVQRCGPADRPRCATPRSREICRGGRWLTEDCQPGQLCEQGTCKPVNRRCTAQDSPFCVGTSTAALCRNGQWTVESCPLNQTCVQGTCRPHGPQLCPTGTLRCGDQCCARGERCLAGQCRAEIKPPDFLCEPLTRRCGSNCCQAHEKCIAGKCRALPRRPQ